MVVSTRDNLLDKRPWWTSGSGQTRAWRTAVVKLSSKVELDWIEPKTIEDAQPEDFAVSRLGTLSAARVTPVDGEPFIALSMYAAWEHPHDSTGSGWIFADSSAHRLISDLSAFVGSQANHRILAAGDLNILYGHGEHGNAYWKSRYSTVFTRFEAIGLPFVGPQAPAGRRAEPWPDELPADSNNVPTYYTTRQSPATATRQLDFVFASRSLKEHVRVQALNETEQWGPSDHCRIQIDLA